MKHLGNINMIIDRYRIFPIAILFIERDKIFTSFNDYLNSSGKWNFEIGNLNFEKITTPLNFNGYYPKLVLWIPNNNKKVTVIFSNVSDGYTNPINNFCIANNIDVIDVTFNGIEKNNNSGKYEFRFGKIVNGKQEERVLQYLKDSSWEYYESGNKLEFENDGEFTHYHLSNEILYDYLKHFDINICESFFMSDDDAYYFSQYNWGEDDFDADEILRDINKND